MYGITANEAPTYEANTNTSPQFLLSDILVSLGVLKLLLQINYNYRPL